MNVQLFTLGRNICFGLLTLSKIAVVYGADVRPVMPAVRVRTGAIAIDGRLEDWPKAAFSPKYQRVADSPEFSSSILTQAGHGPWLGKDDLSAQICAAIDGKTLYLCGTVRDQLLFNEGTVDTPWVGDEFELFLDVNPPEKRFVSGTNENFAQFIFVPAHLWEKQPTNFIWSTVKKHAVSAASRLTPLGYTFEIAVPMAVLPYWNEHKDMDSIGFDMQIGDIDSPGIIGHDAGPKINMEFLQPFPHFKSTVELSTLQFDAKVTKSKRYKTAPEKLPGYAAAQKLLDNFDALDIARQANAMLGKADLARKAALFILSKRADLTADVPAILAILQEPEDTTSTGFLLDARVYAFMALAERKKLPAADILRQYGASKDMVLQQTALWAIGLNGDRSVAPELVNLLAVNSGLTQEIIAVSLARLGDNSGAAILKTIAVRDRGQSFGILSLKLLKELGIDVTP